MKRWMVQAVVLVALVGLAGLNAWAALPCVAAQEMDTAHAVVPQDAGLEWAVTQMDFTSLYPRGFRFQLAAESGGGAIVSARVVWQHRPTNRANEPIRVRRAIAEYDEESGVFTATWEPSGSTNVPPWVAVYYAWELRDEAGNEYVTDRQMVEYADESRVWTRLETDDAIIFSEGLPAMVGEMVASALAQNRQKYLDGWGATLPYKPRIILFHDRASFDEWRVDAIDTTGLGYVTVGITSDAWGGTAQVLYRSYEELAYETVLHEVEHMHQYEYLHPGRTKYTPGWFVEGDARFYEVSPNQFDVDLVRDLAVTGQLPTLLQGTGPTVSGEDSLRGYAMGFMFWRFLIERWGMDIHLELMELLNDDLALNEALEIATGLDPLTLETDWRTWLGAVNPVPPTLVPTPTMLPFPPSPTPFGQ